MKKSIISAAVVVLFAIVTAIAISRPAFNVFPTGSEAPDSIASQRRTMRAFHSEQELKDFFKKLADSRKRDDSTKAKSSNSAAATPSFSMDGAAAAKESDKDEESVTNNQHA